jgi:hypothetical protein
VQARPALQPHGQLVVGASNNSQQRGAHGLFRYFGKLAPDVTGAVLDVAVGVLGRKPTGPVVDLMCGSGTTLLEAADRGWASIGIEVNPVAALYASVKTSPVDAAAVHANQLQVLNDADRVPCEEAEGVFSATHNAERWFSSSVQRDVGRLRVAIGRRPEGRERDVLLAALLSRLRRVSNASARTGRIFHDPGSADIDVIGNFRDAVRRISAVAPLASLSTEIRLADARATGLDSASTDVTFCHPPYFGLYRYSADVLRFELEVGGWARTTIARDEVREGWKSGDVGKLDDHIEDMTEVFREARRLTVEGGVLSLVSSNSTLGDHQLPVIDRLVSGADRVGWTVEMHLERPAHFGSATYHKSARSDKVMQRDHVIIFRNRRAPS